MDIEKEIRDAEDYKELLSKQGMVGMVEQLDGLLSIISQQSEAIERVIAELEESALIGQGSWSPFDKGLMTAYNRSAKLLKEVLANAGERATEHNLPTEKEA